MGCDRLICFAVGSLAWDGDRTELQAARCVELISVGGQVHGSSSPAKSNMQQQDGYLEIAVLEAHVADRCLRELKPAYWWLQSVGRDMKSQRRIGDISTHHVVLLQLLFCST